MPTFDFVVVADATLESQNPATNHGGINTQRWGEDTIKGSNLWHALLRFNIAVLAGRTVSNVTLSSAAQGGTGASAPCDIVRVTQPAWTEAATWLTYDGVNAWAVGGGDYTNVTPPRYDFVWTVVATALVIPSTPAFVAWIQDAIDNRAGDVEMLIKKATEGDSVQLRQDFASRGMLNPPTLHITTGKGLNRLRMHCIGEAEQDFGKPMDIANP